MCFVTYLYNNGRVRRKYDAKCAKDRKNRENCTILEVDNNHPSGYSLQQEQIFRSSSKLVPQTGRQLIGKKINNERIK